MKEFKVMSFIFIIIVSSLNCIEEIAFTVKNIAIDNITCYDYVGTYNFKIIGQTNILKNLTYPLDIDMISPPGAKAECYLFLNNQDSNHPIQNLSCSMDVCMNSLDGTDILLPPTTPKSDQFNILDWEQVIGRKVGETNLVAENVTCLPNSSYTFNTKSVKSTGCIENKNTFSIIGNWLSDESEFPSYNHKIQIKLDNANKDIASCQIKTNNTNEINCEFNGGGDIKFDDSYVKGSLNVYQISKVGSPIHVDKCSSPSDQTDSPKSKSNYYFFDFIVFTFTLILIF